MASFRNYGDGEYVETQAGICTRKFAFYRLTKDETTNFGERTLYVHFGRTLLSGVVILLSVTFVTTLVNQTS
jgi:hypothetical protein